MSVDETLSLAARSRCCKQAFEKLALQLKNSQYVDQVSIEAINDQFGRFSLWAGNIGAFQSERLRSSLDYRLREALYISAQIARILQFLNSSLHEASLIASGAKINQVRDGNNLVTDSEFESDFETESDTGSSVPSGHTSERSSSSSKDQSTSEIQELYLAIVAAVTSLFKASVLIRRPAPKDRYAKSKNLSPYDDSYDIQHAGHKFPKAYQQSPWLIERLGKANTKRRQYFRYRELHREKLSRNVEPALTTEHEETPVRDTNVVQSENSKPVTVALSQKSTPTTIMYTEATEYTGKDELDSMEDFDAGQSVTSFATSVIEDSSDSLAIPKPPEDTTTGAPFECPYCFTIQTIKKPSGWRRHILNDLQPYLCTFTSCAFEEFSDQRSWFSHELQAHRKEWHCDSCNKPPFPTKGSFERHMRVSHSLSFSENQLPALIEQCERPLGGILASACPFCDEWDSTLRANMADPSVPTDNLVVTPDQFRHHVGHHMEQLALFALPRKVEDSLESIDSHIAVLELNGQSITGSSLLVPLKNSSIDLEEAAIQNHSKPPSVDVAKESEILQPLHDMDDGSWSFLNKDEGVPSPHVALTSNSADDHREAILLQASPSTHKFAELAKENGIPLWRKDIHYDFLRAIFENETRVFTRARDGSKGHTFADIYIDALVQSSKTDIALEGLLLSDRKTAVDIATMALLINVGRVGENISFFPVEDALKRFNPVPSLRAYREPLASQALNADHLRCTLRAVYDLRPGSGTDPESISRVPASGVYPVQFMFMVFRTAQETTNIPVDVEQTFFDLFCNESVSSKARARSFLWLVWRYLETDFMSSPSINPFKIPLSQSNMELENAIEEDQDSQKEIDRGATLLLNTIPKAPHENVSKHSEDLNKITLQIASATESAKLDLDSKTRLLELGRALDSLEVIYHHCRKVTRSSVADGITKANRFIKLGDIEYFKYDRYKSAGRLNEAIYSYRQALLSVGPGSSSVPTWLQSLAGMCRERYMMTEELQTLQEAIDAYRNVIESIEDSSIVFYEAYDILMNLSYTKCEKTETIEDLDQAISIGQRFMERLARVRIFTGQDYLRATRAIDLCRALQSRYRLTRNIADLNQALSLCQQAIELSRELYTPSGLNTENRVKYTIMMSMLLIFKYEETGEAADIHRAVLFCENANIYAPQGDMCIYQDERAILLGNLSRALMLKYANVTEDITDLERAITISQQALETTSDLVMKAEFDYYLSKMLLHRYERTKVDEDLHAAKLHALQATNLTPSGHPDRHTYLEHLSHIQSFGGSEHDKSIELVRHSKTWSK